LAAIGGGIAVRRTAYGQVIFSVVGVLELLFVGPLVAAADWVGARWRAARSIPSPGQTAHCMTRSASQSRCRWPQRRIAVMWLVRRHQI